MVPDSSADRLVEPGWAPGAQVRRCRRLRRARRGLLSPAVAGLPVSRTPAAIPNNPVSMIPYVLRRAGCLTVLACLLIVPLSSACAIEAPDGLKLNSQEYLEMPGLNVMLASDYYPEGHQGGVSIILNGDRIATNGDVRLNRTPGQWQPTPVVGQRRVDPATGEISVRMSYPDESKDRKGFNPIVYPDLKFAYTVRVVPAGKSFRIIVDLDKPLPEAWQKRVGFNLELFPGDLFGKSYLMDRHDGIFPRQADGPGRMTADGSYAIEALATGRHLMVAPESKTHCLGIESLAGGPLELIDGRGQYNNGWFVVRALLAPGASKHALEWLVSPRAIPGFLEAPVVQVSQVGYHPLQRKYAVIQLDSHDSRRLPVTVSRLRADGSLETVLSAVPPEWGRFLRYTILRLDFSSVTKPGMYVVSYGKVRSNAFKIADDVYERHVWQPTLEYFLPIQMCHMRVNDRYRVWHGDCHEDDARMAEVNRDHFDGYSQGPSTLCKYKPGEHVPGLNQGGWHDAGDYDLRIESQTETIYGLALAWEAFHPTYDDTTIDEVHHVAELHRPDGKPDILQQIEHGLLSVVGGYKSMGCFYRGIQEATMRQYTLLGDPVNVTDGRVYDPKTAPKGTFHVYGQPAPVFGEKGAPDDRWVFTENNPRHVFGAATALAAAARVLKGYDDAMASDCLRIAEEQWNRVPDSEPAPAAGAGEHSWGMPLSLVKVHLATELLLTTHDRRYADYILSKRAEIVAHPDYCGWFLGRALPLIGDAGFRSDLETALRGYRKQVDAEAAETPYGVPYRPQIWGAGWQIQNFGAHQVFLHKSFPDIFPRRYVLNALEFILGCHPGSNTASFVGGVGANSMTVAYGFNRADWTYIPGGISSGTALIRPDFPELKVWPYFWQQGEYVLGGGTTDCLLLVLGADQLMNQPKGT
ncbi:endoglucanase D precursor [mine drainage metagenome]|uniref:Endoglucanase D n=1 Tax=mine drainage metagenome TaxID=410659 RepID=A0A1J5TD78_9ZZZZ